jgi:hypothetical protein
MTNFEKFKNEVKGCNYNFSITKDNKIIPCEIAKCRDCIFMEIPKSCSHQRIMWLYEEYKEPPIYLSKVEYELLNYILNNKKCEWIIKGTSNKTLYVCKDKPIKEETNWIIGSVECQVIDGIFCDLFHFIKAEDGEPYYSIKEILDNCIIVN